MGFFDKAKDLYQLQKQAKKIKDELKNIHIEAESGGVTVTCDGEQQFLSVALSDPLKEELNSGNTPKLEKAFLEAANKAIKKSQAIGAEKMKAVMGNMGGMMGQ